MNRKPNQLANERTNLLILITLALTILLFETVLMRDEPPKPEVVLIHGESAQ